MSALAASSALRRLGEVLVQEGPVGLARKLAYRARIVVEGRGHFLRRDPGREAGVAPGLYEVWLRRHRVTPAALVRMRKSAEHWPLQPVVTLIATVGMATAEDSQRSVESVIAQAYPHWELLLVAGPETPKDTLAILADYGARDRRIGLWRAEAGGIAAAWDVGLTATAGEFLALMSVGDEVAPAALFSMVRLLNEGRTFDLAFSDEDRLMSTGQRVEPFFKPGWNPDLLLSVNYVGRLSLVRRTLAAEIGALSADGDAAEHDLLLRLSERTSRIIHVPEVLYHRRVPVAGSCDRRPIDAALARRGWEGHVEVAPPAPPVVRYRLKDVPLVSIVISTRDRMPLLRRCLESIRERTSYPKYELVVIDNGSVEAGTLAYLGSLDEARVIRYPGSFNFAAINNAGAAAASGEMLLFLNNDTEIIRQDWLTAMVEQAQRPEVGVVGAKLLYPDGRIQHAAMVLGVGGAAGHAFKRLPGDRPHYFGLSDMIRDCSAVTGACLMVRRRVFEEVGGFDERFRVGLNDVDFCLRVRAHGYLVVYTPLALLYHHEAATRGRLHPVEDERLFWKRWGDLLERGDPYYNPNLTLADENWGLRI